MYRRIASLHSEVSFRFLVIFDDSTMRNIANRVRSCCASSIGIWRSCTYWRARSAIGASYSFCSYGEFCRTIYLMYRRNCLINGFHNASFFIYWITFIFLESSDLEQSEPLAGLFLSPSVFISVCIILAARACNWSLICEGSPGTANGSDCT